MQIKNYKEVSMTYVEVQNAIKKVLIDEGLIVSCSQLLTFENIPTDKNIKIKIEEYEEKLED